MSAPAPSTGHFAGFTSLSAAQAKPDRGKPFDLVFFQGGGHREGGRLERAGSSDFQCLATKMAG